MTTHSTTTSSTTNETYARRVARFVAETAYEALPPRAVEQAKNGLLDILGCALGGARVRASRAALAVVQAEAGTPQATVLTTGRKAAISQAAFANAVLASVLDLDDGNYWSFAHAGAGVIPSALATAEARGGSGRDLLLAVVLGYEVTNYAGAILNQHHRERFYGTGSGAAYGAAAAVARLIGLDVVRTGDALGVARAHMPVSPILEFAQAGPMPKESIGWGAMTGTVAALLAEQGFTGPENNFDEPNHTAESDLSPLEKLGREYTIVDTYRKYFPACLWTHAAVSAALELRARHNLTSDNIDEVTVWTNHRGVSLSETRPISIEAAQYCIPFTIGAALLDGELGVDQMHEDRLSDPRIHALADRVRLVLDPRLDAMFPGRRAARTGIRTRDGRQDEIEVLTIKGSPEAPMSEADVDRKFIRLASPVIGSGAAEQVLNLIRELEQHPVERLTTALTGSPAVVR